MPRLTGRVFDVYDDVDGRVLRSVVPSLELVPDFVKTAHRLTEDQRDTLPDDRFALILLDQGTKLKKYAMVDKGNTALSIMYLLEQQHLLPQEAVKVAACNLMEACDAWGLVAPEKLEKLAATPSQKGLPYKKGAKAISPNVFKPNHSNEAGTQPRLGEQDGANDDVDQRTNMSGVPGSNFLELPSFSEKEKVKTAGAFGDAEGEVRTKQKSWRQAPYVDVSEWGGPDDSPEKKAPEMTLLEGRYPIDGYDQVKTASAYFETHWRDIKDPRQRHQYCVKLAERMEKLGMEIPEDVERYGSTTYAADVDSYVGSRRSYLLEEFRPLVDVLLEKRAQVGPDTFAEALCEFDQMTGLRWHWDGKVADPWYSTFGPSIEKLADKNWTFEDVEVRIREEDLLNLVQDHYELLAKTYGETFAAKFRERPKAVFEQQDKNTKIRLARLATDDRGMPVE